MNQVDILQSGIDYIEENLAGKIDNAKLQSITSMSSVQFQKTFLGITGYTVGEYIRNRRLTAAAFELLNGCVSVLDTALKYGYDSSEGFSRAFRDFHGVNPNEVKKGKTNFNLFNKITLEIKVNGGSKMKRFKKLGILLAILVVACVATLVVSRYEQKQEQVRL